MVAFLIVLAMAWGLLELFGYLADREEDDAN